MHQTSHFSNASRRHRWARCADYLMYYYYYYYYYNITVSYKHILYYFTLIIVEVQ